MKRIFSSFMILLAIPSLAQTYRCEGFDSNLVQEFDLSALPNELGGGTVIFVGIRSLSRKKQHLKTDHPSRTSS